MKKYILLCFVLVSSTLMAQKAVLIKEDFRNKMEDKKEWSDLDITTKVADKEGKFTLHTCRYFANSSPALPSDCSKGRVNIEMIKKDNLPFLEFPELPSCGVLKIGVQANGKDTKRTIALQKFENNTWVAVDEIEMDAPPLGTCIIWEPKNAKCKTAVKFRLVAPKYGNVYVNDVYAEAF